MKWLQPFRHIKKLSDKQATTLITAGFIGTLKNWLNNYLTEDNGEKVVNETTIIPIIKTQLGGKLQKIKF